MFDAFATGGLFPRKEDIERLKRYRSARKLFDGRHHEHVNAKRIADKLRESNASIGGLSAEGVVYLIFNSPRLICTKFADLQILQTPEVRLEGERSNSLDFIDELLEDQPGLWAELHYALELKRAMGDGGLVIGRNKAEEVRIRAIDPAEWFPVLSSTDTMDYDAHQLAWIEEFEENRELVQYLRVDYMRPGGVDRLAFVLGKDTARKTGGSTEDTLDSQFEIGKEVKLDQHWPDLAETDEENNLGDLIPFVHIPHGRLAPLLPFGRPEFTDSGGLVDDLNWRLSTWSDANDKVAHPPRIIPRSYLKQSEDGDVSIPSQYERVFVGKSNGEPGDRPGYMSMEFSHETLREQFELSLIAFLMRHEMAPALLGWQTGKQRESGEAKSLGMGTTEAATKRDVLQLQPRLASAFTIGARLKGNAKASASVHMRTGLPKSQDEIREEVEAEMRAGLMTKRDALERLNPTMSPEEIEEKLAALDAERQAEAKVFEAEIQ